jgi:hypothetical protein
MTLVFVAGDFDSNSRIISSFVIAVILVDLDLDFHLFSKMYKWIEKEHQGLRSWLIDRNRV